jgi:hypothetical protein
MTGATGSVWHLLLISVASRGFAWQDIHSIILHIAIDIRNLICAALITTSIVHYFPHHC